MEVCEPSLHPTDGEAPAKAPATVNGTSKPAKGKTSASKVSPTKSVPQNQTKAGEKRPTAHTRPSTAPAKPLGNGVMKKAEGPDKKSPNAAPKPRAGNPAPSATSVKKVPSSKPIGEGQASLNGKKVEEKKVGLKNGDPAQPKPMRASTGKPVASAAKQPAGAKPTTTTVKTVPAKPERLPAARPAPARSTPPARPASSATAATNRTAPPPTAGRGPTKDKQPAAKPRPAAPSSAQVAGTTPDRSKPDAAKKDAGKVSTPSKSSTPSAVPSKAVTTVRISPTKAPKAAVDSKPDAKAKGPAASVTPKASDRAKQPLRTESPAPKTSSTKPGSAASPTKQATLQKALSTTPKRSTKPSSAKATPKKESVYSLEPVAVPRRKPQSLASPGAEDAEKQILVEDKEAGKLGTPSSPASVTPVIDSPLTPSADASSPENSTPLKTNPCQFPEAEVIVPSYLQNNAANNQSPAHLDGDTLLRPYLTESQAALLAAIPPESREEFADKNNVAAQEELALLVGSIAQQCGTEGLGLFPLMPQQNEVVQELLPQISLAGPCPQITPSTPENEVVSCGETEVHEAEMIPNADHALAFEGSPGICRNTLDAVEERTLCAETNVPYVEDIPSDCHSHAFESSPQTDLSLPVSASSGQSQEAPECTELEVSKTQGGISSDDLAFETKADPSASISPSPLAGNEVELAAEIDLPEEETPRDDCHTAVANTDFTPEPSMAAPVLEGLPCAEMKVADIEEDIANDHGHHLESIETTPVKDPIDPVTASVVLEECLPSAETVPNSEEAIAIDTHGDSCERTETESVLSDPLSDASVAVAETLLPDAERVEAPSDHSGLVSECTESLSKLLLDVSVYGEPVVLVENSMVVPLQADPSIEKAKLSTVNVSEEECLLQQPEVAMMLEDLEPAVCELHADEPNLQAKPEQSPSAQPCDATLNDGDERIAEEVGLQVTDQAPQSSSEAYATGVEANPIQEYSEVPSDGEILNELTADFPDVGQGIVLLEEKNDLKGTEVNGNFLEDTPISFSHPVASSMAELDDLRESESLCSRGECTREVDFAVQSLPEIEIEFLSENDAECEVVEALTSVTTSRDDLADEHQRAHQPSLNQSPQRCETLVCKEAEDPVDQACAESMGVIDEAPQPLGSPTGTEPPPYGSMVQGPTDWEAVTTITSLECNAPFPRPILSGGLSGEVSSTLDCPPPCGAAEYLSIGSQEEEDLEEQDTPILSPKEEILPQQSALKYDVDLQDKVAPDHVPEMFSPESGTECKDHVLMGSAEEQAPEAHGAEEQARDAHGAEEQAPDAHSAEEQAPEEQEVYSAEGLALEAHGAEELEVHSAEGLALEAHGAEELEVHSAELALEVHGAEEQALDSDGDDLLHKPHNLPLESTGVPFESNATPNSSCGGEGQSPLSPEPLQEQSLEKGPSKSSTLSGPDLAGKSSSETSTPEELRDYDSSSGVESKSDDKLGGSIDPAFHQTQQLISPLDDLPADQDLGIHMEKGDDEAETLLADELLGDPHTEPTVSSEEHSETEMDGDLSLNGLSKCPAFEKLDSTSTVLDKSKPLVSLVSPPCKPSLFHSVEESDELGSGDAGTETPASTNSAASYDVFDGAFHLHSTDSCGKSPGVSSLDSEEHLLEGNRDHFPMGLQREIGFSVDSYSLGKEEDHRTPSEDEDDCHAFPPEPPGWKQEILGSGSTGWLQQSEHNPAEGGHEQNLLESNGRSCAEPEWVVQPIPLATFGQKEIECDLQMPTADTHPTLQSYSATPGVGTDNMASGNV